MRMIFAPFADWTIERGQLGREFLENVQMVLGPEQMEQWPTFLRRLYREKNIHKGRLAGEDLNLFAVLNEMTLDRAVESMIEDFRKGRAALEDVERPAIQGDVLLLDYQAVDSDGKPIPNRNVKGYTLELGADQVVDDFEKALAGAPGLWQMILLLAVLPAVCEELAFRGFILSGFRHLGHKWRAIVYSALFFGLTHSVLQQSMVACVLGLVLGYLAVQSGSLTLSANSPENGTAVEELEVDYGGQDIEIGFNSRYLQPTL